MSRPNHYVYIVWYCDKGHVDVVISKTGNVDVVISKKRGVDVDVAARGLESVDVEIAVMVGVELGLGVWREVVLRVCEYVKPFSSSIFESNHKIFFCVHLCFGIPIFTTSFSLSRKKIFLSSIFLNI